MFSSKIEDVHTTHSKSLNSSSNSSGISSFLSSYQFPILLLSSPYKIPCLPNKLLITNSVLFTCRLLYSIVVSLSSSTEYSFKLTKIIWDQYMKMN